MKTPNRLNYRSLGKKLALSLVTASLVVSCGSDNKNKTDSSATNYSGSNPVFQSSAQDLNHWNGLKNKYQCNTSYGSQGRLPDLNFVVQGGQSGYNYGYSNTVSGQLTPGGVGGAIQGSFAGVNFGTRDLIYVTKVNNGSSVVYNVTISLCSWMGQYQHYIGGNAQLSNFMISAPLVLNQSSGCSIGIVSDGWITFTSSTFGAIPTRFSSSSCL